MAKKETWDIKKASKGYITGLIILLVILGALFLFMALFSIIFLIFSALCFYCAYRCSKELERRRKGSIKEPDTMVKTPEPVVESSPVKEPESPYVFLRFNVAGVTFKNGRKTRQAILRAFKWEDEIVETVDFELYEWEGKPAVYVKINDQVVGNVPANTVEKFLEHEKLYKRDNVHCDIFGGNKLDDGSRTNYGCEIIIRYKK